MVKALVRMESADGEGVVLVTPDGSLMFGPGERGGTVINSRGAAEWVSGTPEEVAARFRDEECIKRAKPLKEPRRRRSSPEESTRP